MKKYVFSGLALLIVSFFALPALSWERHVYAHELYLDLNSARVEKRTKLLGVTIASEVEENPISKNVEPVGDPNWKYAQAKFWWISWTNSHNSLGKVIYELRHVDKDALPKTNDIEELLLNLSKEKFEPVLYFLQVYRGIKE